MCRGLVGMLPRCGYGIHRPLHDIHKSQRNLNGGCNSLSGIGIARIEDISAGAQDIIECMLMQCMSEGYIYATPTDFPIKMTVLKTSAKRIELC